MRRVMLALTIATVLMAPVPAAAQGTWDKGWIDVNFGIASAAEKEYDSLFTVPLFQEVAGYGAGYDFGTGGSFDVGGGYMFNRYVGLGVSLAGTAHEDPAALAVIIPHPFVFNAEDADATTTNETLERTEGAFHIQAMFVPLQTPRVRLRGFAGPSYINVEQDTISYIGYDQVYQILGRGNTVDITTYRTEKSEAGGWGFHAGADFSVFFNRVIGVGTVVRFSRATVELDDFGGAEERKAGGFQFGGGLRLKF